MWNHLGVKREKKIIIIDKLIINTYWIFNTQLRVEIVGHIRNVFRYELRKRMQCVPFLIVYIYEIRGLGIHWGFFSNKLCRFLFVHWYYTGFSSGSKHKTHTEKKIKISKYRINKTNYNKKKSLILMGMEKVLLFLFSFNWKFVLWECIIYDRNVCFRSHLRRKLIKALEQM